MQPNLQFSVSPACLLWHTARVFVHFYSLFGDHNFVSGPSYVGRYLCSDASFRRHPSGKSHRSGKRDSVGRLSGRLHTHTHTHTRTHAHTHTHTYTVSVSNSQLTAWHEQAPQKSLSSVCFTLSLVVFKKGHRADFYLASGRGKLRAFDSGLLPCHVLRKCVLC